MCNLDYRNLYQELLPYVRSKVTDKRFKHILGVVKEASRIAVVNNLDELTIDKLRIAALLHDVAKDMVYDEVESFENEYKVSVSYKDIIANRDTHGYIAANIAYYKYKIEDLNIINSIKFHTTGRPNMTLFEKIIFVADYTEENRNFPNVEQVRDLCLQNIDYAVFEILDFFINICEERNIEILDLELQTLNYYQ